MGNFSCSLHVLWGQDVWCFIVQQLPTEDYMQLWRQGYFRTIFPRLKHRGSFGLWCGDGMTGHANQALSFSVNMFYSLGSVRALPPFVCVKHQSYSPLRLAAENHTVFGKKNHQNASLVSVHLLQRKNTAFLWKLVLTLSYFFLLQNQFKLSLWLKLWPWWTIKVVWTETLWWTSVVFLLSFLQSLFKKEHGAFI